MDEIIKETVQEITGTSDLRDYNLIAECRDCKTRTEFVENSKYYVCTTCNAHRIYKGLKGKIFYKK